MGIYLLTDPSIPHQYSDGGRPVKIIYRAAYLNIESAQAAKEYYESIGQNYKVEKWSSYFLFNRYIIAMGKDPEEPRPIEYRIIESFKTKESMQGYAQILLTAQYPEIILIDTQTENMERVSLT